MKNRITVITLCAVLLALYASAQAQLPIRTPRIGYLIAAPLSASANRTEAFRQGLRDLGYVEGKNITIEWRSAEGKVDLQRALVAELLRLNVDIIVTGDQDQPVSLSKQILQFLL